MNNSVKRIALISVHTSPTDLPGTGDGGGLNVYVREIASRLAERGVAVDIYTRRRDPEQADTVMLDTHVTLHHLKVGPAAPVSRAELVDLLPDFTDVLAGRMEKERPDLVHAQYWLAGVVARGLRDRLMIPFVHTFHTLGVLKNATLAPQDTPEPYVRLAAEREICRDADRLLVLTCGEARLLHRAHAVTGARIDVVPAGVDGQLFAPAQNRRTKPRASAPKLLFVGRLQPLKGPDIAIRTLAELRKHLPDATLTVIGGVSGNGEGVTGPRQLSELARTLGVEDAVRLMDAIPQTDLVAHYHDADLVLAPSRSETFGLVALEAQACGTPVVAAAVSGLQAVVGAAGTLVQGHDPKDHAAAAHTLLNNPVRWNAAAQAGIAAAQRSTWDHTAERLLRSYTSVLSPEVDVTVASTG